MQNAYHKVGEGAALSKIAVEEEFADPPGQKKVKKKNKYAEFCSCRNSESQPLKFGTVQCLQHQALAVLPPSPGPTIQTGDLE